MMVFPMLTITDYGDVVDGARERHPMCHAGSVNDPAEEPSTKDKITTTGPDIAKYSFAVYHITASVTAIPATGASRRALLTLLLFQPRPG
jgi:hypothetical protein